ncbi:uncharacterized protein LOC130773874 [Actinidia eriantha]|uniref:uncharacterized protein LOC130773874 n=1 Tax=Actinidia eriantha TaxID=165200 RepID=UPI0025847712|nr:uncharacterized protein LOC130773874 [Actinidia eriantha]
MATDKSGENFVQSAIPRFDGHYDHWSMLMENFLRSKEYWDLMKEGYAESEEGSVLIQPQQKKLDDRKLKDLKVKNYLFRASDCAILETILQKDTSKQIWDSTKKKYQGSTRVKRQQLQALRKEFETLQMKEEESVYGYFARVLTIANKMRIHGEALKDVSVIEKILRSMSSKFLFVVCSIEESHDIDEMSVDELQDLLLLHEQRMKIPYTELQALKVSTQNDFHNGRASCQGRGRGRRKGGRGRGRSTRGNRDGGRHRDDDHLQLSRKGQHDKLKVECYRCGNHGHYSTECYTKMPKDKEIGGMAKVECYRCGNYGHYSNECYTKLPKDKERGETLNFVEKKEEETLVMVCHTKEEHDLDVWNVNTSCSNHMCGSKSSFSFLNESFRTTVSFGDSSTVNVMEKGDIHIRTKNDFVEIILNVFYVPILKTNLLSAGQL